MQAETFQAQDVKYIVDVTGKRREVIVPYAVWKDV